MAPRCVRLFGRPASDHAAKWESAGSSRRSCPGTNTTSSPIHSFLWEGYRWISGSSPTSRRPTPTAAIWVFTSSGSGVRISRTTIGPPGRLYLFGWGDGGGGPTAEMLESARRLADTEGVPRLTMEGPRRFFTDAEAEIENPSVWVGELYPKFTAGPIRARPPPNSETDGPNFDLREAELWSALKPEASYPHDDLDGIWKLLLLHQFHDIIPGSGIHWVYQDTARDHAEIRNRSGDLSTMPWPFTSTASTRQTAPVRWSCSTPCPTSAGSSWPLTHQRTLPP